MKYVVDPLKPGSENQCSEITFGKISSEILGQYFWAREAIGKHQRREFGGRQKITVLKSGMAAK
jgi:hypothetical protein